MEKNKGFNHNEVLSNEAVANTENRAHSQDCENCSNPLLFGMQDNHHKFSLGLFTVLDCLRIAEKEGYVPPLSDEWWLSVHRQYDLDWPPK